MDCEGFAVEQKYLSFLYPDRESEVREREERGVRIEAEVLSELGLTSLLPMKNSSLPSFFTRDGAVIAYRQAMFCDLLRLPELSLTLRDILPLLFDITELRRLEADYDPTGESYLYSITEVELYVSCIARLYEGLAPLSDRLESEAFRTFAEVVTTLASSDYYKKLNADLSELSSRIREVRSITVGVNLDATMRPVEAGVLSVNSAPFKSGRVLDKILRLSFKNDAMTTIAPLTPFDKKQNENRRDALLSAFHGALDDVFRSSVRGWRAIVGEYVLDSTDFLLRILPEIEFITRGAELCRRLGERGYTTVFPTVLPLADKAFTARALYNPDVALRIDGRVVENDLAFDELARIYILTGPNRGGKSVVTCALGQAQAMFQLGLPVAAEEAAISPVSAIFTHFPTGAEDTLDKGRLGEECARLREIFDAADADALVLLDESLSSTGAYEASFIAAEILAALAARGVRALFSTHLHELGEHVDEINRRSRETGGVAVDTLVAGIEEGQRSFRIHRKKPDGKSYARDIAEKYGLSFEGLKKK